MPDATGRADLGDVVTRMASARQYGSRATLDGHECGLVLDALAEARALRAELEGVRKLHAGACDRAAAQSALLSRRAERDGDVPPRSQAAQASAAPCEDELARMAWEGCPHE